jgi:hypothetical protein
MIPPRDAARGLRVDVARASPAPSGAVTLLRKTTSSPGTHALVVGVGRYPWLVSGKGKPRFAANDSMGQLNRELERKNVQNSSPAARAGSRLHPQNIRAPSYLTVPVGQPIVSLCAPRGHPLSVDR